MRQSLLLLSAIVLMASCRQNKSNFNVIGDIAAMPEQSVRLEEIGINEIKVLDSAKTDAKGHFELSGNTPDERLFRIHFAQNKFILLSAEKGNIKVTGNWDNLENYSVEGSAGSASLRNFVSLVRENLRDINTMSIIIDSLKVKNNDSMLTAAKKDMEDYKFKFTRYIEMYADTTKFFPVAMFSAQMLNPAVEKDYLLAFSQNLTRRFPHATQAKEFESRINKMLAGPAQQQAEPSAGPAEGTTAPDIDLPTPEGNKIALSSFKGKYVLLDFWASWCGPCRHENPNVVAAFQKYKSKNFTVFSVSLDNSKDKWQEAIKRDNLTWTHVSDLKGWGSDAAAMYGVQSIPANFLLDPSGKIIARDLRGDDLEAKLQEVLK
ncbi:MAG: AhpC/TSA family protein [Bacteroidetes bacterium]|nr:AhpC/TSA family protein [Bacteroidota bacterium]